MNEADIRSVRRCIRALSVFAATALISTGFGSWYVNSTVLKLYRDYGIAPVWKLTLLDYFSSPATFVLPLIFGGVLISAGWNSSLPKAAWASLIATWLAFLLILTSAWFYWNTMFTSEF